MSESDPPVAPEGIEQIAAAIKELEFLAITFHTRWITQRSADDSARPSFELTIPTREVDAAIKAMEQAAILLRLPRVEPVCPFGAGTPTGWWSCSCGAEHQTEGWEPRVEGGREDQEPTKSLLRAEATEMTVNTTVPQPASGDSSTPAPEKK